MTDLLAILVDRALDRAPVLERRRPAIFETVAEAAFSDARQFKDKASLEEEDTTADNDASPAQRPHPPAPFPTPSPTINEAESQHAKTQPTDARPRDVDQLTENNRENIRRESVPSPTVIESNAKPVTGEARPNRALVPRALARPEDFEIEPQRLIETIVERRVEREVISEHVKESPAKEAPARAPLASPKPPRETDEQPKTTVKIEAKPLSPPNEQTNIKPSTQKLAPRRDLVPVARPVPRAEPARAPQPPTPPAIHVTIGRVEVRATPQASAKPKVARTAGPRMSLDDYLRSRGERN